MNYNDLKNITSTLLTYLEEKGPTCPEFNVFQDSINQMQTILAYRLGVYLYPEYEQKVRKLLQMVEDLHQEYIHSNPVDFFTLDRLKKESGILMSSLGDEAGKLKSIANKCESYRTALRLQIKKQLISEGTGPTNAEQDSKMDPRYLIGVEEISRIEELSEKVFNKFQTWKRIHQDINQSVSTSGVQMVIEGGKFVKNIAKEPHGSEE